MKNKCVFAIGPESSGSMLIAKICAHVLGIQDYGTWNGVGWIDQGAHKVCHRSLPYGSPPRYPVIDEWIAEHSSYYELYFILTTRDRTISELSRMNRFGKSSEQVQIESENARQTMLRVMERQPRSYLWSYETFMFLGKPYLDLLYEFLDVTSSFIPALEDGNKKRISPNGQPPASTSA